VSASLECADDAELLLVKPGGRDRRRRNKAGNPAGVRHSGREIRKLRILRLRDARVARRVVDSQPRPVGEIGRRARLRIGFLAVSGRCFTFLEMAVEPVFVEDGGRFLPFFLRGRKIPQSSTKCSTGVREEIPACILNEVGSLRY